MFCLSLSFSRGPRSSLRALWKLLSHRPIAPREHAVRRLALLPCFVLGANDIYASMLNELDEDGTFGPAVLVTELSSPFDDQGPAIRRDGLEIFLGSNRPGSIPPPPGLPSQVLDLWVATRARTSDPWSTPVNLGPVVNSAFTDAGPALSRDGTELYFQSAFRSGNVGGTMFDIWKSTRTKLKHPD